MTKEGNQGFKSSTKYLIYENGYIDNKVKVRDHFHITGNIEALHIDIVILI